MTNALDNIKARIFMDSRCVSTRTPLLEPVRLTCDIRSWTCQWADSFATNAVAGHAGAEGAYASYCSTSD